MHFFRYGLAVGFLSLLFAASAQAQEQKPAAPKEAAPALNQAALEKEFAEKLSGCVFAGQFSVTGRNSDKPPATERYTISKVTKLQDDYWLFLARVQYGQNDVTVPMTLQVKWAGDTPVITLTDLTIPKLGTFTSRVVIYGDRYAGTWQHGKTGGHLWGMIEKPKPEAGDKAEKKQ